MSKRFYSIYIVCAITALLALFALYSELTSQTIKVKASVDIYPDRCHITYSDNDREMFREYDGSWNIFYVDEKEFNKYGIPKNKINFEKYTDGFTTSADVTLKVFDNSIFIDSVGLLYIEDMNISM